MIIVTNIYKTARAERMQFRWLPVYSNTGLGSRIEWLKYWFEFYPAWRGLVSIIGWWAMVGTLAIGLLSALGGCAASQREASTQHVWYVGQGVNVTECGPAAAAMAVNWGGGRSDVRQARAVTRQSGLWTMADIDRHVAQHGRNHEVSDASLRELLEGHPEKAVIIRMKGIVGHYVMVYGMNNGMVRIADPLYGVSWGGVDAVEGRRSGAALVVSKQG